MASTTTPIPSPRIQSPTPDPSSPSGDATSPSYFPPTTRSSARKSAGRVDAQSDASPDIRSRSRSRSQDRNAVRRRHGLAIDGMTALPEEKTNGADESATTKSKARGKKPADLDMNGGVVKENGHLSPYSAALGPGAQKGGSLGMGSSYWRSLSRSPSPLGLIPVHRSWRSFIHRHEVPRKVLHISIGFISLDLFTRNFQTSDIHPTLLALLIPIFATDLLRHAYQPMNEFYIKCLGPLMRESEAHDHYNGVIWYLLGAWSVVRFAPSDVAIVSIVLLSWCDTAASTVGRRWGKYTPRVRKGKSLAGSIAAFIVGVGVAWGFWGWLAPLAIDKGWAHHPPGSFAFTGRLGLPTLLKKNLGALCAPSRAGSMMQRMGFSGGGATCEIRGQTAVGVLSVAAGFIASVSEAVDIFGWDDNITIPTLCGIGLWGFLNVFGA